MCKTACARFLQYQLHEFILIQYSTECIVCVWIFTVLIPPSKVSCVTVNVVAIAFFSLFFWQSLQFFTHSVFSHRKLLTAEFLVSPEATKQASPAHWLPFHQGGGGVQWGKRWMSRWVASGGGAVGEPLADRMKVKHWPTVLSHSRSQLVALGQGPSLLTKLVPLTCHNHCLLHMDFPWVQQSLKEMAMCYWFKRSLL